MSGVVKAGSGAAGADVVRPFHARMPAATSQKAFAVLALGASLLGALPVWGASLQDRIVAVINTEVITLTELEEEVGDMKAQTRRRYNGAELKIGRAHV